MGFWSAIGRLFGAKATIEIKSTTGSRCQIGNTIYSSTGGRLIIEVRGKETYVNGKPLSKGLPDGVTMERV